MKPRLRDRAVALLRRLNPVLHPILFAVYPLLALFAHNQSELDMGVLWVPLALCVGVAAALYGVLALIFKRGTTAGVLASFGAIAFFYYGSFASKFSAWGIADRWFLLAWVVLFAACFFAVARTRRDLRDLTLILTAGAVVLVLLPLARIAIYELNHRPIPTSDPRLWPTELPTPVRRSAARLPDVYVLIPDDYARADVLRRYFHYDSTDFIGQLKKRGFVLSEHVRSPYSDSEMNIAAEVNMDYLSGLASILGRDSQDVRPVRRLIHDSRASRLLKALGYRYIHLDTDQVTFPGAGNPHISPIASPDSFMTLWLQQSVLRWVGGELGFNQAATDERFRKTIDTMLSRLATVPLQPGPKFVLFHTLLPHDPYIFGANGEPVTFPDTSDEGHSSRLGMRYYVQQAQYTETRLLEATDAILARSKEPPIVVILSDEGFEGSEDVLGEATMRDIRVKGFAAFYLPGTGVAQPPVKLNTVNALRFVFNRAFGTHYPMLRSASYPELDAPYQFEEMPVR